MHDSESRSPTAALPPIARPHLKDSGGQCSRHSPAAASASNLSAPEAQVGPPGRLERLGTSSAGTDFEGTLTLIALKPTGPVPLLCRARLGGRVRSRAGGAARPARAKLQPSLLGREGHARQLAPASPPLPPNLNLYPPLSSPPRSAPRAAPPSGHRVRSQAGGRCGRAEGGAEEAGLWGAHRMLPPAGCARTRCGARPPRCGKSSDNPAPWQSQLRLLVANARPLPCAGCCAFKCYTCIGKSSAASEVRHK
jgi:hypothetical protein